MISQIENYKDKGEICNVTILNNSLFSWLGLNFKKKKKESCLKLHIHHNFYNIYCATVESISLEQTVPTLQNIHSEVAQFHWKDFLIQVS